MKKLVLLLGASLLASTAGAEPPKDFYGTPRGQFLACHDRADLETLIQLRQDDPAQAAQLREQLFSEEVPRLPGIKRCGYGWIGPVQFGENVDIGPLSNDDGTYFHGWLTHVGNSTHGFWILWTEVDHSRDA